MATSVIVIGGGVGGLTAAHELVERGFTVDVYEARPAWGGKARSQPVPGTGTGGRKDLPGEHGFRFYPRFYTARDRHDGADPESRAAGYVVDHLRPTTESAIALVDRRARGTGSTAGGCREPYERDRGARAVLPGARLRPGATSRCSRRRSSQFLTASDERRLGEYEHMSWWDFLEGDLYSANFQRQLRAVPRTMVAMDPQRGSARTVGDDLDAADPRLRRHRRDQRPHDGRPDERDVVRSVDRAPRSRSASSSTPGVACTGIDVAAGAISGVQLADGVDVRPPTTTCSRSRSTSRSASITPAMGALDPALERLRLANADDLVSWMVGIQYFLYEDVPLVRGHTFFPDSPWALTTISQPQFWRDLGLFRTRYGDGEVGGLISVDISDWDTPGKFIAKPAKQCTREEIAQEVWAQLKAGAQRHGRRRGDPDRRRCCTRGTSTTTSTTAPASRRRTARGCSSIRPARGRSGPRPRPRIPNLVLASDYVRTHTDLASMEGASEAARRAVNAILARSGSTARPADVWPLVEPTQFRRAKRLDAWLYRHGRRHVFEILGIRNAARAAHWLRRLETAAGLAHLDDWLDDNVRLSRLLKKILAFLGVG